uniref:Tetraspanin n=1 Tax=Trichuris muris TaxID=70415 RepID=A0A5S6QMT4_TRIMR
MLSSRLRRMRTISEQRIRRRLRRLRARRKAKKLQDYDEREEKSSHDYKWLIFPLRCVMFLTCCGMIAFCSYMVHTASKVLTEYRAIFDPVKISDGNLLSMLVPTFSLETYVCVGVFILAIYLILANLVGLHAAFLNSKIQARLYSYSLLFPVLVGGAALVICMFVSEAERDGYVASAYEIGLRQLYGSGQILDIWTLAVDTVQVEKKCCGFNASALARDNNTATYLTILYWLESTNWGAKQADGVNYNESAIVPFVPVSCCIKRESGCNTGVLSDRLAWDNQKETYWASKIYAVGCQDRLPGIGEFCFGIGNPVLTMFYVTIAILFCSMTFSFFLSMGMDDGVNSAK